MVSKEKNMKNIQKKNTQKEFYFHWTRKQLIKELCRLNQLLIDMLKIITKVK